MEKTCSDGENMIYCLERANGSHQGLIFKYLPVGKKLERKSYGENKSDKWKETSLKSAD